MLRHHNTNGRLHGLSLTHAIYHWYYDDEAKNPGKLDKNRKEFVDLLNRQIQNASSQRMFNSSGLVDVLSRLQRTAEDYCYGGLAKPP